MCKRIRKLLLVAYVESKVFLYGAQRTISDEFQPDFCPMPRCPDQDLCIRNVSVQLKEKIP